jgi:hypothetical protein
VKFSDFEKNERKMVGDAQQANTSLVSDTEIRSAPRQATGCD